MFVRFWLLYTFTTLMSWTLQGVWRVERHRRVTLLCCSAFLILCHPLCLCPSVCPSMHFNATSILLLLTTNVARPKAVNILIKLVTSRELIQLHAILAAIIVRIKIENIPRCRRRDEHPNLVAQNSTHHSIVRYGGLESAQWSRRRQVRWGIGKNWCSQEGEGSTSDDDAPRPVSRRAGRLVEGEWLCWLDDASMRVWCRYHWRWHKIPKSL